MGTLCADILPHESSVFVLKDMAMIHEGVCARCLPIKGDKEFRFVFDE